MSSYYLKTKYFDEEMIGPGAVDNVEHTLYAWVHNTCDIMTYYDENFENPSLCFNDTVRNNIVDAIVRLDGPWKDSQNLAEGVEHCTPEEVRKMKGK
tara:strand:- start:3108 stop:3398 length:291 start_codon:yes stop_codon:yes gene_type:complete